MTICIGLVMLLVGVASLGLYSFKRVGAPAFAAGAIVLALHATGAIAGEKVPLPPTKKTANIVNAAKLRLQAKTIWPALSQREVNDVTARAKAQGKNAVNIFCYDEAKCADLALALENAFESAHWTVVVRFTSAMIPPGFQASPKVIKTLATIDPGFGLSEDPEPEAIESISIGEKPQGRLE